MLKNQDSLIEIAIREMSEKKRRPRTLANIAKDVFEIKGLTKQEGEEALAQFQIDFMLSGYFICCGEDRKGAKLWDLKTRQHSSLLDKEGVYVEDPYDEDEDVIKNELKDDNYVNENDSTYENGFLNEEDDDDEDEEDEKDDIEEELVLYEEDDDDEDEEEQ